MLTFGQRHDYERSRQTPTLTVDPATGLTDTASLGNWNVANNLPGGWSGADGITRQAGGVLHINKWLSVHYNQSDNFQVTGLGEDFFGNVLPNPSGHGKDYGIAVNLLDNKLVAEINWYKSDASNSREGATNFIDRAQRIDTSMFIPWAQEVATNTLGVNASASAINNFAEGILKQPTGMQAFANGVQFEADTQVVQAKGYEVNLTYNPLPNWTMKFAADEDESVASQVYPHVQAWLAARLPVWTKATDPVLGAFWTTVSAGNVGNDGTGSPQQWLAGTVDASGLDIELAQQSHVQPDLSKYSFSYLTNYQFVSGFAKGVGVGTAFRYQTPAAIGYYGAAPDPSALGAIDGLQAFNPIYGKEVLHQDLWISYRTRLPFLDRRVRMKIQLNVKDIWSDGYLQTVGVNPDGSAQAFRIIPPRIFYLTTTFDF